MEKPVKRTQERAENMVGRLKNLARAATIAIAASTCVFAQEGNKANAVEIPEDTSLSDGVKMLKDASKHESFETLAIFVELIKKNGERVPVNWNSLEGEVTNVALKPDSALDNIERFLGKHRASFESGDIKTIVIKHFHNHPLKSALHNSRSNGEHDKYKSISAPPSPGFLHGGDTSINSYSRFRLEIEEALEKKYGTRTKMEHYVIDMFGMWQHHRDSGVNKRMDNIGKLASLRIKLYSQMKEDNFLANRVNKLNLDKNDIVINWLPPLTEKSDGKNSEIHKLATILKDRAQSGNLDMSGQDIKQILSMGLNVAVFKNTLPDNLAKIIFGGTKYEVFLKIMSTYQKVHQMNDAIERPANIAFAQWLSRTENANDEQIDKLLNGDLYKQLQNAYKAMGVTVTFSPIK